MLENSYNVDILRLGEVCDFDLFKMVVSDYLNLFDKVADFAEREGCSVILPVSSRAKFRRKAAEPTILLGEV